MCTSTSIGTKNQQFSGNPLGAQGKTANVLSLTPASLRHTGTHAGSSRKTIRELALRDACSVASAACSSLANDVHTLQKKIHAERHVIRHAWRIARRRTGQAPPHQREGSKINHLHDRPNTLHQHRRETRQRSAVALPRGPVYRAGLQQGH